MSAALTAALEDYLKAILQVVTVKEAAAPRTFPPGSGHQLPGRGSVTHLGGTKAHQLCPRTP